MDLTPAHLHLMLNHVPILGSFFLALLMIIGLILKSRDVMRVALILTVLFPVATYAVQLTGESAEEALEDATWFDEDRVHDHEERAEAAVIASIVTGILALVALWASRRGAPLKPAMALLVLLALLVSAGMMSLTALDGGEIRHEELRESIRV